MILVTYFAEEVDTSPREFERCMLVYQSRGEYPLVRKNGRVIFERHMTWEIPDDNAKCSNAMARTLSPEYVAKRN